MYHWRSLHVAYDAKGTQEVDRAVFDRRWDVVKKVVAELQTLGPIIRDGKPTDDLEIRWISPGKDGPGPQLFSEIEHYGTKYLLVANPLDEPLTGVVFGMNAGNTDGFAGSVFLGKTELSIDDAAAKRYNSSAVITVAPRGAGVFKLHRRPIEPPK